MVDFRFIREPEPLDRGRFSCIEIQDGLLMVDFGSRENPGAWSRAIVDPRRTRAREAGRSPVLGEPGARLDGVWDALELSRSMGPTSTP